MSSFSQYLKPKSKTPWMVWLLSACAFAALLLAFNETLRLIQEESRIQSEIATLRSKQALASAKKPARKDVEEQKKWSTLQAELDFPWDRLFRALERAATTNIELLEFYPDKVQKRVILRGEAKDHAALMEYIGRLTLQDGLRMVHVTRMQSVKRDQLHTVAFEIKADLFM